MLSESQLGKGEQGICLLAEALGIDEKEIVKIINSGMSEIMPESINERKKNKYFIDEMKATFDCY